MKIFHLIIFTTLWIGKVYSQNQITNMDIFETEVLETIKEWNEAFAQNDAERYFTFIHEDLSLFIAACPYRIDGKNVDKEEFVRSLKYGRTKVSLFQELQPHGQMLSQTSALVTYHTRGLYGSEGQEQMVYLKETNVLLKLNNQWKIIHLHVSR
jgi:ketosteroid isomerase-like protein